MELCAISWNIFRMMIARISVRHLIIITKSEISIINHCWVLCYETTVCAYVYYVLKTLCFCFVFQISIQHLKWVIQSIHGTMHSNIMYPDTLYISYYKTEYMAGKKNQWWISEVGPMAVSSLLHWWFLSIMNQIRWKFHSIPIQIPGNLIAKWNHTWCNSCVLMV